MKEYLSNLEDNGMLHYDSESQKYKITEKGLDFIRIYTEIHEMIKVPPSRPRLTAELQQQYVM